MTHEPKHVTRLVRLSSLTICCLIATHTCLETARDTLFLERVPIEHLPWMYVGVALLSLVIAISPAWRGPVALPLMLAGCGVGTLVFWAFAGSPTRTLLYALYLWTAFAGGTAVAQFWTSMARLFTLGESKRVFATIAIGAVAGSIVGAAISRGVFLVSGARPLVLVAGAGFLLSAGLALFLRASPNASATASVRVRDQLPAAAVVWRTSYLLTIGQLTVVAAITVTILDYAFKRAIVLHFHADQIGTVVSSVALVTNAIGGIVQVFFVPRVLTSVGTARALRLLPALLVLGAFAGVVMPFALVAVGLHVIDGSLRYSLQRTATELLYVPISEAIRGRVKTVLDIVCQRGGQAVASLALLAIPASTHTHLLVLGVAGGAVAWFWVAHRLRPQYLALFRGLVLEGALKPTEGRLTLDQAALEALLAALSSQRVDQVIFSLDVLARGGKPALIPSFILFHPAPRVVLRALDIFASHERKDAAPMAWRLLTHEDGAVRAQAVHTVAALDFDVDRLRGTLSDSDPRVATTALVELWARGAERAEEVSLVAKLLSPEGDVDAQRWLLRALATTRSRRLLEAALPLAQRAGLDVQREIANALIADPIPAAMPVLFSMLEHWSTREPARRAMVAIGDFALAELSRAVHDESSPWFVRAHAPRSISRFSPEQAVPLLLELLLRHPEGVVRYKALRGLGRLATNGAEIPIDDVELERIVERDVGWTARALQWRERLEHTVEARTPEAVTVRTLLADLLLEKGRNAGERLFRVIALRYRSENWELIFDGFRGGRHDASRELVEGVLREPLRGRVLSLVDELAERVRAPRTASRDEPLDALLSELAAADDHVIEVVSAHYGSVMNVKATASQAQRKAKGDLDAVSSAH